MTRKTPKKRVAFTLSPEAAQALVLMTDPPGTPKPCLTATALVDELIVQEYHRRRKLPVVEDQSRNGVKVLVSRYPDGGTTVDAACDCLGGNRAHSNPECPSLRKKKQGNVKVISDKPIRSFQVVCSGCDHMLEYTLEDVKFDVDSDGDATHWVVCPRAKCKEKTYVKRPARS
jgi:hypothetical protein